MKTRRSGLRSVAGLERSWLCNAADQCHKSLLQVRLRNVNPAHIDSVLAGLRMNGREPINEKANFLCESFGLIHQINLVLRQLAIASDFAVLIFHQYFFLRLMHRQGVNPAARLAWYRNVVERPLIAVV